MHVLQYKGVSLTEDDLHIIKQAHELQRFPVSAASLDVGKLNSSGKSFCSKCGFWVNPLGHNLRCRVPTGVPTFISELAWLGDAAWEYAVRDSIIIGVCDRARAQTLVANTTLADYFDTGGRVVDFGVQLPANATAHTKANLVEASFVVSVDCRLYMADRYAMGSGLYFERLGRTLLSEEYDAKLANFIHPLVDGYCYLPLLDPQHAYEQALFLGRYPLVKDLKSYVLNPSVVRLWYYHRYQDYLHIFDQAFTYAEPFRGTFYELVGSNETRIGGMKNYDLTLLFKSLVVHDSWPVEVKDAVSLLDTWLVQFHTVRAKSYHAMCSASVGTRIAKLSGDYDSGQRAYMLRTLTLMVTSCRSALPLFSATNSSYIATTGLLSFSDFCRCDFSGFVQPDTVEDFQDLDLEFGSSTEPDTDSDFEDEIPILSN